MIIEQFMIASNRAVGMRLCDGAGCGIYRIHEPPTEASISELVSELGKLGYDADMPQKDVGHEIQKLLHDFKGKKTGKRGDDDGAEIASEGCLFNP